jgi:asparagine synthase (glutamine-hydrolysing)
MCGIGGVVVPDGKIVNRAGLQRMGHAMTMRGPDDEGIHIAGSVGLIHRRLSILDLSEHGKCPISNEDGSIQALLNGEIYNWRELRAELGSAGHQFKSTSDSEVLAHGYEAWGEALFSRLRGMFSVAIWDNANERLLLARDRMGEKPLFFRHDHGLTVFASTLDAMVAYEDKPEVINADAIACFLSHGFVPATHTAWKGIRVFPPAHYAVVQKASAPRFHRFWKFPESRAGSISVPRAEALIERMMDDSVHRCLDADVPVGVFLSGGVDSSIVAALAARHQPGIHSFCVGFTEAGWSELEFARLVSAHIGSQHHEAIVRPEDVLRVLPGLVWHHGQPFGDPSAVPTYVASCLAKRSVTVCLSGDGGDESFAGYWRVQAGVYAARYGTLVPESVRRRIVPRLATWLGTRGNRLAAMNKLSLVPAGSGYKNSESWLDMLDQAAGPALRDGLHHDLVACRAGRNPDRGATVLRCLLLDDFKVQLPDEYLAKVDVSSMAASLEVRSPFLDVAVVEAAWGLPDRMKLHWGARKWLLKRIAARLVPERVVYRPKMGFAMPLSHWFKAGLGRALEKLLKDSVAESQGWIDSKRVLCELNEHRAGKRDNNVRLWLVLWLEVWFRVVVTREMNQEADLSEALQLRAS